MARDNPPFPEPCGEPGLMAKKPEAVGAAVSVSLTLRHSSVSGLAAVTPRRYRSAKAPDRALESTGKHCGTGLPTGPWASAAKYATPSG